MDPRSLFPVRTDPGEPSTADRIRDAALCCFAAHGASGTSLRAIAETAEVSIGLVQHHFGTKARLRAAVDEHVLRVVGDAVASAPLPAPPRDALAELGHRVTSIMTGHPEVVGYLVRAMIEGEAVGSAVFDGLVAISAGQWDRLADHGLLASDVDRTWAVLHPLVLVLGTAILRPHLDRHLPEPLTDPAQLRRWDDAVAALLSRGLLRGTD
ncbi:TetR/AcrR family transcriptional regulator [Actinomadura fibrosa]|uniref:TetR/AcrR family transcriptional regulator n=1 Tax=Actinomadura fibrosa TaxID=111802 RepID=A0ABW2XXT5_9ACTN|nr:TetR/AcrR family transcriptional regulator [Actinomadura fibrosa]